MPLSTSTLFANRTMLRSIFIALEAMALFSDACLFLKHVCNFFPLFRLQSYNFFPINFGASNNDGWHVSIQSLKLDITEKSAKLNKKS